MKDRGIYEAGKPFYLEVVFTGDEINQETDSLIGKALVKGEDLLPGLKLNSVFGKFVTKDLLMVDSFTKDLEHLKNEFDDLLRKYNYKKETIHDERVKDLENDKEG